MIARSSRRGKSGAVHTLSALNRQSTKKWVARRAAGSSDPWLRYLSVTMHPSSKAHRPFRLSTPYVPA